MGLITLGVVTYANDHYIGRPAGVKTDGIWFKSITSRGTFAWGTGILLTFFYIVLYWYPTYLGYNSDERIQVLWHIFNPLSCSISGLPASQWFVYGTLYMIFQTLCKFASRFKLECEIEEYQYFRKSYYRPYYR